MKPLTTEQGITIKQLKDYVKDLPEKDKHGEDYEFWVDGTDCREGLSNIAKSLWQLNEGDLIVQIDREP